MVRKLLRREDRLSSLLKASSEDVQANVKALGQLLNSPSPAVALKSFLQVRAREQEIKAEIDLLLCAGGSTRLDHSDVEALARVLNRIAKGLRKFAERYLISASSLAGVTFEQELLMLQAGTDVLHEMVSGLGDGIHVAGAKLRNDKLLKIDAEADDVLTRNVVSLYQGRHPPMTAIMLKDLYEQLGRVFDRCQAAGELVLQIVLKNS